MKFRGRDPLLVWLERLGGNALLRQLRPRPFVLNYPPLAEDPDDNWGLPLALFRRQLEYLRNAGYRFLCPDDFLAALARPRPGRVVLLSFDGGLRSTVRLAYPVMRELGASGVLYVAPELVPAAPLAERAGPGARASWSELRALDPAVLRVGNHGRRGLDCGQLSEERDVEREIWQAGLDIEQQLGYPVRHFCCPAGGESLYEPARLATFGYTSAVVHEEDFADAGSNPFALPRLTAAADWPRFTALVSGTLALMEGWGRRRVRRPALPAPAPPAAEPAATRARAAAAGGGETGDERARGGDQSRR